MGLRMTTMPLLHSTAGSAMEGAEHHQSTPFQLTTVVVQRLSEQIRKENHHDCVDDDGVADILVPWREIDDVVGGK